MLCYFLIVIGGLVPPSLIYYIVILFSSNYLLGHAQKQPFRSTRSYNASLEYLTLNTARIFRRITKINMLRKQDLVDQKGKKVFLILSKGKKKKRVYLFIFHILRSTLLIWPHIKLESLVFSRILIFFLHFAPTFQSQKFLPFFHTFVQRSWWTPEST